MPGFLSPMLIVVALLAPLTAHAETAPIAYAARVLGDDTRTRLIVEFDREVTVDAFLRNEPARVVVDLGPTLFSLPDKIDVPARSLVAGMRYGVVTPKRSRIVLDLNGPARVETSVLRDISGSDRQRLLLDIVATEPETFAKQVRPPEKKLQPARPQPQRRHTVILDAGHGGIDVGAVASDGVEEKSITLAFVQKLKALLEQDSMIDVITTRSDDSFIRLPKRLDRVRASQADLFISVHADSLKQRSIRGATVYTLSRRGSDTLSRLLAQKQNRADMVAGLELPEVPTGAADILIDLTRRETESFSQAFADELVGAMGKVTRLINNPHRSADFYVLKAPEVPSVLLELGYLSNAQDEAQLVDPVWQQKAAERVRDAIVRFLRPSASAGAKVGPDAQ